MKNHTHPVESTNLGIFNSSKNEVTKTPTSNEEVDRIRIENINDFENKITQAIIEEEPFLEVDQRIFDVMKVPNDESFHYRGVRVFRYNQAQRILDRETLQHDQRTHGGYKVDGTAQ